MAFNSNNGFFCLNLRVVTFAIGCIYMFFSFLMIIILAVVTPAPRYMYAPLPTFVAIGFILNILGFTVSGLLFVAVAKRERSYAIPFLIFNGILLVPIVPVAIVTGIFLSPIYLPICFYYYAVKFYKTTNSPEPIMKRLGVQPTCPPLSVDGNHTYNNI